MVREEVPNEIVEQILREHLQEQPQYVDYMGVLAGLEGIRSHLRKFGAEPDELDVIFQPITLMIEENIKAKRVAAEAKRLITEFKQLVSAKEDNFIKKVRDLLDENVQSGNSGTRMLALTLIEKLKTLKDKP